MDGKYCTQGSFAKEKGRGLLRWKTICWLVIATAADPKSEGHCDIKQIECGNISELVVGPPSEPLLIVGVCEHLLHLLNKFKDKQWLEDYGDVEVPIVSPSDAAVFGGSTVVRTQPLRKFLRQLKAGKADELYSFDSGFQGRWNLFTAVEEDLGSKFTLPPTGKVLKRGLGKKKPSIGVGMHGGGFTWHSHEEAWNLLLSGGPKEWYFYAPGTFPEAGFNPTKPLQIWLDTTLPRVEDAASPLQCVQKRGEIVVVPDSWHHATTTTGSKITANWVWHASSFLPHSWMGLYSASKKHFEQNHYPEARKLLDQAMAGNGKREALVYERSSNFHKKAGNLSLAIDAITEASRLNPQNPLCHMTRCQLLLQRGDYGGAREALDRARALIGSAVHNKWYNDQLDELHGILLEAEL